MPYLALDTSTEYLSLAITTPDGIVGRDWLVGQKHAELTLPRLGELLADTQLTFSDIEGVAFGMGPGSFTGLRIGCGIAQGLAFAHDRPVVGICTLEALAEGCAADKVLACLDARMNQIYTASYARENGIWKEIAAPTVCDPHDVPLPETDGWHGVGSGFAAYGPALVERLGNRLASTDSQSFPHAARILALALPRFAANQGVAAHEASLLYLRDKVALKTSERTKA